MPAPERWRVWVAVVTATLALPFLVLDNADSAAPGPDDEAPASLDGAPSAAVDPGVRDLGVRAATWTAARSALVAANVDLAVALAEQSRAALESQIAQLAASQRAAEEAYQAELARRAEEERARRELEAAERQAADQTAAAVPRATTTTTTTTAPPPASTSGEPTSEQWASLRACESAGNYRAVSGSGRFRGAYQFSQATWDHVAGTVAPHLVGVDPAAASPADQDLLAWTLYGIRGAGQWPTCGSRLTS